jgi:hypothetical protein
VKKFLLLALALVTASTGLWANDFGVVEPAGKDDALVIVSFKFPRLFNLDPGPDSAYLMTIDPWITDGYLMGKDGELFYMGNLKTGRTYRISQFVAQVGNTITTYTLGRSGNDAFSVSVDKPGIIYLGDFEYNSQQGMHLVGKTHELQLLQKLSGNLLLRPTWKAVVDQRIKELK